MPFRHHNIAHPSPSVALIFVILDSWHHFIYLNDYYLLVKELVASGVGEIHFLTLVFALPQLS
jgi:hypothetical protein